MTAGNRRAGCWRLLWLAVPFALLAGAGVTYDGRGLGGANQHGVAVSGRRY